MTKAKVPFFSIIIPTYNRPRQLIQCLEAITRLRYPHDRFEVIVVDDGSSPPIRSLLASCYSHIALRAITQTNAGPAVARNAGAKLAKGEYLAFTDDDCLPEPEWMHFLAKGFLNSPRCIIGGRTKNLFPDNIYASASHLILNMAYEKESTHFHQTSFVASNNLAIPTKYFLGIGGFNESFKTAEDRELCDRWKNHGYPIISVPEAMIYHAHGLNFFSFCKQHFNYGRGAYRFHKMRAKRGKGILTKAIQYHLNYKNWLLFPFKRKSEVRAVSLAALLLVWQVVNTAGFLWDYFSQTIHLKATSFRESL